MRKVKAIGEADINTYSWVFLGYGLINPYYLAFFFIILTTYTLIFIGLKNYLFKYDKPVAYYGVILIAYISAAILLGGY